MATISDIIGHTRHMEGDRVMVTYPAVLSPRAHIHPALHGLGVCLADWESVGVTADAVFHIDDSRGFERWLLLRGDIDTGAMLTGWGVDPDQGRTVVEIRPIGTEMIVRTGGDVIGYVLLDDGSVAVGLGDPLQGGQ